LLEEKVEALAERLFLFLGLGEGQQKRIAQHASVGKTEVGNGSHRIDAFRGRNPHSGATGRPKEAMQILSHPA
jgi:hypothetical protein